MDSAELLWPTPTVPSVHLNGRILLPISRPYISAYFAVVAIQLAHVARLLPNSMSTATWLVNV